MVWYKPWTWFEKKEDEWLEKTGDVIVDREEKAQADAVEEGKDNISRDIRFRNALMELEKRVDKVSTLEEWESLKSEFDILQQGVKGLIAENPSLKELCFEFSNKLVSAKQRIGFKKENAPVV